MLRGPLLISYLAYAVDSIFIDNSPSRTSVLLHYICNGSQQSFLAYDFDICNWLRKHTLLYLIYWGFFAPYFTLLSASLILKAEWSNKRSNHGGLLLDFLTGFSSFTPISKRIRFASLGDFAIKLKTWLCGSCLKELKPFFLFTFEMSQITQIFLWI